MTVIMGRSYYLFFSLLIGNCLLPPVSLSEGNTSNIATFQEIMETSRLREDYVNEVLVRTTGIVQKNLNAHNLIVQINDYVSKFEEEFIPELPQFHSTPYMQLAELLLEVQEKLHILAIVQDVMCEQVWNCQIIPRIKPQLDSALDQYSRSISKNNLTNPSNESADLKNLVNRQINRLPIVRNYFESWSSIYMELALKKGMFECVHFVENIHPLIGAKIRANVNDEVVTNAGKFDNFRVSLSFIDVKKFKESNSLFAYYFLSVYHLVSLIVKFSPEYKANVLLTHDYIKGKLDEDSVSQIIEDLRNHIEVSSNPFFDSELTFVKNVLNSCP